MANAAHIYTELLGATASSTAAPVVLFSASDAFQTVLRDVCWYNGQPDPQVFQVWWTYQDANYTLLYTTTDGPSSGHLELRQVIPSGATVYGYSSSTSWTMTLTGYRFSRPGAYIGRLPAPT